VLLGIFAQSDRYGIKTVNAKLYSQIVKCRGLSGTQYSFEIHEIGTIVMADSGAYMFLKLLRTNIWQAIYVGETDNLHRCLNEGLKQHRRWSCIRGAGATHIAILRSSGSPSQRRAVACDLKCAYMPLCNR